MRVVQSGRLQNATVLCSQPSMLMCQVLRMQTQTSEGGCAFGGLRT